MPKNTNYWFDTVGRPTTLAGASVFVLYLLFNFILPFVLWALRLGNSYFWLFFILGIILSTILLLLVVFWKRQRIESKSYTRKPGLVSDIKVSVKDDLKKIEGIGPAIEKLLNDSGIYSFAKLADTEVSRLGDILTKAGPRFVIHNPQTWAEQARLARDGRWEELKTLQEQLTGGR